MPVRSNHPVTFPVSGSIRAIRKVNLEVDVLARYMERLLQGQQEEQPESRITMDFLQQNGFA